MQMSPLFTKFTASASATVSMVTGHCPHSSTQDLKIIYKNIKDITSSQFQDAHNLNIWTLIATFAASDSKSRDILIETGENFIGIKENEKKVVQEILNLSKPEPFQIAMIVYPELINAFEYQDNGMAFFNSGNLALTLAVAIKCM